MFYYLLLSYYCPQLYCWSTQKAVLTYKSKTGLLSPSWCSPIWYQCKNLCQTLSVRDKSLAYASFHVLCGRPDAHISPSKWTGKLEEASKLGLFVSGKFRNSQSRRMMSATKHFKRIIKQQPKIWIRYSLFLPMICSYYEFSCAGIY